MCGLERCVVSKITANTLKNLNCANVIEKKSDNEFLIEFNEPDDASITPSLWDLPIHFLGKNKEPHKKNIIISGKTIQINTISRMHNRTPVRLISIAPKTFIDAKKGYIYKLNGCYERSCITGFNHISRYRIEEIHNHEDDMLLSKYRLIRINNSFLACDFVDSYAFSRLLTIFNAEMLEMSWGVPNVCGSFRTKKGFYQINGLYFCLNGRQLGKLYYLKDKTLFTFNGHNKAYDINSAGDIMKFMISENGDLKHIKSYKFTFEINNNTTYKMLSSEPYWTNTKWFNKKGRSVVIKGSAIWLKFREPKQLHYVSENVVTFAGANFCISIEDNCLCFFFVTNNGRQCFEIFTRSENIPTPLCIPDCRCGRDLIDGEQVDHTFVQSTKGFKFCQTLNGIKARLASFEKKVVLYIGEKYYNVEILEQGKAFLAFDDRNYFLFYKGPDQTWIEVFPETGEYFNDDGFSVLNLERIPIGESSYFAEGPNSYMINLEFEDGRKYRTFCNNECVILN